MLQSTSQIARAQDFLATEGCNWRFIPPHGPHFGGLWEAAANSMTYHLRRILDAHVATLEEIPTLLAKIQAYLHSTPLCASSSDSLNPTFISWTFLIGKPLPNYFCWYLSHATDFPHGNLPTTLTVLATMVIPLSTGSSTANAGRGHSLTYNQESLSCWGKATLHHYIGLQLSSPTSIHIRWHRMRGHT